MRNNFPFVSVIIPSLHGREEDLTRLRSAVLQSGIPRDRVEVIAAIGVSPNGRARDVAALHARGTYLLSIDADVAVPEPGDLRRLVTYMEQHRDVGLAGPAQQIPPSLPDHQIRRAQQLPRTHVNRVESFTETDMVTHACLILRRELFIEIGMEHPNLVSGTDPDLRHRVRSEGLKVGLVPDTRVYHPPIREVSTLLRKSFNGGRRSRWVKRRYPRYHLSAEPHMVRAEEYRRQGLRSRLGRHLRRVLSRLRRGHFWALASQGSYLAGHLWEALFPRNWVREIPYPEPPSPTHPQWGPFLEALKSEGEVRWLHRPRRSTPESN